MLAIIITLWILATDPVPHINPTLICPNGQNVPNCG